MSAPDHQPLADGWLDTLLETPDNEQRISSLQSSNLLNLQGLSQLLDQAMHLARSDPGKAQQLTLICANAAKRVSLMEIFPRATYVRAQTHALNGELTTALELIQVSRSEYEAIGDRVAALRTNLGKMHVLNELGRHMEALDAGQEILDKLDETSPQAKMMLALANLNRGVCYETMGRYEEALEVYDIAEAQFAELDMMERIGDVSNNRGIVLVHLGQVSQALEAFEKALQVWAEAELTLLQAQTLSNIGEAHLVLGNYTRSLKAFEEARGLFEGLEAEAERSILLRKTADAYLALNLYPEALSTYREASEMLEKAGMSDHRARAFWGMGAALIVRAQYEQAEIALEQAAGLFAAAGNIPMLCSVRLEQAALEEAQGEHEAALNMARQALELVSAEKWPVEYFYANLRLADLLLPDTAASEKHLAEAGHISMRLRLQVINYRLNSRLGRLQLLQGRVQEAQAYFETAITQIETLRGSLAHEAARTSFLQDKTAVYQDLIRLHLVQGGDLGTRRAFEVAEQAKSRTLVDLLTGVISPYPHKAGDSPQATRLKTLLADLSAAYNEFLDSSRHNGGKLPELQERAARLEQEISLLRLQEANWISAPDPFNAPLSFEDLQLALGGELSLLDYHILDDELLAFILREGKVRVVRQVGRASEVQNLLQRLNAQWDRFRLGREFVGRHLEVMEKSTQRVLQALYAELFAPLEAELGYQRLTTNGNPPTRLTVVPHGVLHQVPFHALHDGHSYLIDAFEISYALSATAFALGGQKKRPTFRRGLVMGVADALIPEVDAEARSVARQLERAGVQTELLTGELAKRERLQLNATECDVIHLACHGLFRADNPMFSALKFHDDWLMAADVMQLHLDSSLVSLSACESGRNQVILGDEVIGFPRAFIGAGASSVLVSLWLVQDETTVALMSDWYQHISAGVSSAAALRYAQQALRERYPHPYYWAPFVLIGQR